jgi:hypothetical protein
VEQAAPYGVFSLCIRVEEPVRTPYEGGSCASRTNLMMTRKSRSFFSAVRKSNPLIALKLEICNFDTSYFVPKWISVRNHYE